MRREDQEQMIVWGCMVPFVLCLAIFVVAVMRAAWAHDQAQDIPQVVEPAGYSYGPEIPVCDEPLWERIKDRCAGKTAQDIPQVEGQ